MEVGMQIASSHTLDLDPTVTWRLVGTRRRVARRREAPLVAPVVESPPDRITELEARAVDRRRREWIRPGIGAAFEFAMFAATLAAIGVLELQVTLLP
jgi:hypothetical protein